MLAASELKAKGHQRGLLKLSNRSFFYLKEEGRGDKKLDQSYHEINKSSCLPQAFIVVSKKHREQTSLSLV